MRLIAEVGLATHACLHALLVEGVREASFFDESFLASLLPIVLLLVESDGNVDVDGAATAVGLL